MKQLILLFEQAIKNKDKYIAVKIQNNCPQPEIIINPYENFTDKLDYYKKAYNEDLTLKTFNKIKILSFKSGNTIEEVSTI